MTKFLLSNVFICFTWTTWFIVIGIADAMGDASSASSVSATTFNYATTVPLSGNDHGTTALSKEDISKDSENTANETSGVVGMPSTVHGAAGDDQHSGPSPHTANVQSTILSVAPSDGHGTTVVSSDGGAMELHSTVTSGVRSSAGHSTEGGSADAATGNKPGSDFSKEHNVTMETTAVIEQATSGFQGDWDNRTVSNITASEHNSGASIPLLSSTVDPVTGRDSTATLSISLSSTMSDLGKTCFQEGETKGNSVPGPDGMTPITCNCSVHDSKVSCDIYSNSNVSNILCFLASENITCSKIQSICDGNLTEDLQKEIRCEPRNQTGTLNNNASFTDEFSTAGIATRSAISGSVAVETASVSAEGVSLSGHSVAFSTTTEKTEHKTLGNVNVVDNENFILLSWNQTFTFGNVVIYLNEKKQAFNNCSIGSTFDKSTVVNCSLELHRKLSPGELLNVTVVVDDSINSSTSYVKQPVAPKNLAASVANKSVCFTWIQEGFYDRFQAKLFLPINFTYSEVYDNVTDGIVDGSHGNQTEACIDFAESLCPVTELRLELSMSSHNRTSGISNASFYSAPSDPVVSCSRPSNSSFRLEITMQNLSEYCLDVSNLPQSNFTHRYSVTPLTESAEQYSASFSSGSSVTDVKVSYAGVTYQIEASTAVNGVWSRSSLAFCTTSPNPPSGVELSGVTCTSASFTWSDPNLHVNESFVYHCQRINGPPLKINETRVTALNATCVNLNACENYKVSVRSIVKLEHNGNNISSDSSTEMSFWTLPERVTSMNLSALNHSSLKVIWNHREVNHGVTRYNIELRNSSGGVLQNLNNISGCTEEYEHRRCHVFNGLTSSTNYTVRLCAVNPVGGTGDAVEASKMTLAEVSAASGSMAPAIVAVSVTVVLLLLLVVIVLLLLFFCRQQTKFAVPSSKRPSDILGFPNPSFSLALEPLDVHERMKPVPVPYDEFLNRVEELHKDSDFSFSAEYTLLQEMSPKHMQKAAEMEDNRIKNRYSNILPFDHSRVKLIPLDDDDQCSDYINANYMPGFSTKREFIAAQGPMKSTVDEFWRMIWEQHVTTIVMVTNLQERGREKCAEYWPMEDEPMFYGDIQVQLNSESQLNYYIIRVLEVKLGDKKRTVKHLHFIAWPDFGCPENTAVLLDFVTGVRSHMSSPASQNSGSGGPMLVHCSAGVGRTGTFILVDRLLQHLRSHNAIDVFGLVLEMRNYRCNMIQTESQYIFAYECIKTAIERQMESSRIDEADENADESPYQNVTNRGVGVPPVESLYQNFKQTDQVDQTVVEMESSEI